MPLEANFASDCEFTKLLGRSDDVDLTTAALELARDAYPDLDFALTLEWINARSAELSAAVATARSGRAVLAALVDCLAEKQGIHGDKTAYESADSSYLNRVIETKLGIPISLSVVYMAVARSLGVELEGVAAPMHFLTRYDSPDGPLILDAFGGGRIMTTLECIEWLEGITGLPVGQIRLGLKPVGPRPIIIRMLNNLKVVHAKREDWQAALRVQQRLMALQPSAYQERRDLALIALKADHPGQAITLFKSCLKSCPDDESKMLQQHIENAKEMLARWN